MRPKRMAISHVAAGSLLVFLATTGAAETSPPPTPSGHLRVVTWNLEFFNDRSAKTRGAEPDRTSTQLDALARRIKGFDAAVLALQEIDQIAALDDLRARMGDSWAVFAGNALGLFPQQNALLYDAGKVDLLSAAFVHTNPDASFTPSLYPTWMYRSPVTGVFAPKGRSDEAFRVIGIHGHYNDPATRTTEGCWLAGYVSHLLADSNETRRVILLGDFNGAQPAAPHKGLVSGGNLANVPKRNGDPTTIHPNLALDYIYVTDAARRRLTDPTAFVLRPEHYGETGAQFEGLYSDHLPVLVDYAIAEPSKPSAASRPQERTLAEARESEGKTPSVPKAEAPLDLAQRLLASIPPPARRDAGLPLVGAIRWDAWTGGWVTDAVQRTLGPAKYHERLPWFAEVRGDGQVKINGSRQIIMDTEIAWAAYAGLDYWAFVLYPEGDAMSVSLARYLQSPRRKEIRFCLILHGTLGVPDDRWPREEARIIELLKEPGYVTVLDNRPLVYEFCARLDNRAQKRFDGLRAAVRKAGLAPYYVFMGWNPVSDWEKESPEGFDAVSHYASATAHLPTYAELARKTEGDYWQRAAEARVPSIPLVTTGWNKEPRRDHPVSWEEGHSYLKQTVFISPPAGDEIARHLQNALAFVKEHPDTCRANAVIMYAWNEHDEGGWLVPTWTAEGTPNTARLDAIRRVLRPDGT